MKTMNLFKREGKENPKFDDEGLGAQAMAPCRVEGYLKLTPQFLQLLIGSYNDRDDVSFVERRELRAMCQIASDEKLITRSTFYELEKQIGYLPSSYGYTGDQHGEAYPVLLDELYDNVYTSRAVSVTEWRSLADAIDARETDIYPEERQTLTKLFDRHIIEVENAACRDRKFSNLVKYNAERLDYVSYNTLLREAEEFYAKGKSAKTCTQELLRYKLASACEIAVLTRQQVAYLSTLFRL